jgi:hypothetical protein
MDEIIDLFAPTCILITKGVEDDTAVDIDVSAK